MSKFTGDEMRAMMEAHIEQMKNYVYKPNNSYWEQVVPTYIENWPTELMSLSVASVRLPLTIEDAIAIGTNICEFQEGFFKDFNIDKPQDISHIVSRIDKVLDMFPKREAFIRLGSRSPKDSYLGYEKGFKGTNGHELISILLDCSERIYDDLRIAIYFEYKPSIWIREFVDIPNWSEFRCFVKNKELIGISQYNYFDGKLDDIVDHLDAIETGIRQFFNRIKPILHLDDVIFDVYVKRQKVDINTYMWEVKLIEINPFFGYTDPCLFKWVNEGELNIDGDKFFMYCTEYKKPAESLDFLIDE